jgi:hypothetical protein
MITRKEYLYGDATHRQYYGQFVTDAVTEAVCMGIGRSAIVNSADPHFNDIHLARWDALYRTLLRLCGEKILQSNDGCGVALSDIVCVAKAAAQLVREKAHDEVGLVLKLDGE